MEAAANESPLMKRTTDALRLLVDLVVFAALTAWYSVECIVLTLLPDRWRRLKSLDGQVALVTGGGSGVGRLLAQRLARLGCKVVVWDISEEGLTKTCEVVKNEGFKCYAYKCDVSEKEQVYSTALRVKNEVGSVDLLINNAGTVFGHTILELPDAAIESTYKVNILAHYWTVKAFLPDMISKKNGHIVTLGSVAGMLGTYRCIDYSATKAAAIAFHESLFTELKTLGHDYINVTLVCPYFINTGMFEGATPRLKPMLEPDFVADSIVSSVQKNEINCVLPDTFRMLLPLKCLLPAKVCWELMNRVIQGPQVMMQFKGRPKVAAG